eukprot:gnl/MRDRNA2_/MRDRNA2_64113_c0_seq1.p1 gnl/MRDRNA2_/MRDRNA2_64113_c0~~gnl/MRDRNA2_/MRDRNA2_64113_c0_seq1.p1  ORF type:complete len:522 (-),score=94.48 gnl/MRDRNA2_/MRDRNA2_64113_c0_seq1:28-1593(-)
MLSGAEEENYTTRNPSLANVRSAVLGVVLMISWSALPNASTASDDAISSYAVNSANKMQLHWSHRRMRRPFFHRCNGCAAAWHAACSALSGSASPVSLSSLPIANSPMERPSLHGPHTAFSARRSEFPLVPRTRALMSIGGEGGGDRGGDGDKNGPGGRGGDEEGEEGGEAEGAENLAGKSSGREADDGKEIKEHLGQRKRVVLWGAVAATAATLVAITWTTAVKTISPAVAAAVALKGTQIGGYAAIGAKWSVKLAQVYSVFTVLLYFLQRKLIFFPPSFRADPQATGGQLIKLPGANGENVVGLYFPAKKQDAPILVYWHGNADQIGWGSASLGPLLGQACCGCGFLGIEYPGYSFAGGSPTETSIAAHSEKLLKHLSDAQGLNISPDRIVLVGQSIGCAAAVEMATRGFGKKMILLSPFTSLQDMAVAIYPIVLPAVKLLPFLVRDKMDNAAKAGSVKIPTIIIHGTIDEVVPFRQGRELASRIPGAQLVPLQNAGHNNLFDDRNAPVVFNAINNFVC